MLASKSRIIFYNTPKHPRSGGSYLWFNQGAFVGPSGGGGGIPLFLSLLTGNCPAALVAHGALVGGSPVWGGAGCFCDQGAGVGPSPPPFESAHGALVACDGRDVVALIEGG